MSGRESSSYNAPLLYKAFAVIEEIAGAQMELGVSDISRRLNMPKSTVYGITQALLDLGVLRQGPESKKFRLGPTLVRLGNQALAGINLRSLVHPFMEELCDKYKETIFLGTFDQYGITIIEKVESPSDLKISAPVGTRIPMFAGASAKVFLAWYKESEIRKIIKERALPRFTKNSITDVEEYLKELEKVRQQGYATDFEEYIRGVNAISVPIHDPWGWPIAALWMVGFTHSFTREKMMLAKDDALRVAIRISTMLVHT